LGKKRTTSRKGESSINLIFLWLASASLSFNYSIKRLYNKAQKCEVHITGIKTNDKLTVAILPTYMRNIATNT